jgi:hypothetical protein
MNEQSTITGVKAAAVDIDTAYDLLEQATGLCQAYSGDGMEPTAETLGTVSQFIGQAMALLGDDDADEPDTTEGDKAKPTPKSIERFLREAGLTRSQAKGLLAKGYTAIAPQREAATDTAELSTLFNQFKL